MKHFLKNITLIQKSYRKYRVPDSYLHGNSTRYDQRSTYIHANNNYKSSMLKKIELVYFEESENKHEIEKVAHCRVKALGNENIMQMMDQENISS